MAFAIISVCADEQFQELLQQAATASADKVRL